MTNYLPINQNGLLFSDAPTPAAIRHACARHAARLGCAATVVYVAPGVRVDALGLEVREAATVGGGFWVGRLERGEMKQGRLW